MKLLSHVRLFATPWTVAYQAPPSMRFSRQEYWSGLPFPSPGDLPYPGIEPWSPALQADTLTSQPPGKPNKVHLVKAMVFPVVMYGYESRTIKKAEHRRTDAFELWCWRRFLRVLWTSRRSNQSILKEISPECSLEGQMLKLKLQYLATWCEELTHLKRPWCWERLRTGREGDDRGWDGWMASLTQWTWVWVNSKSWWWTGMPGVLSFMGPQIVEHNWVTELTDWKCYMHIFI